MKICNVSRANYLYNQQIITRKQNFSSKPEFNSVSFKSSCVSENIVIDKAFRDLVFDSFDVFYKIAKQAYCKLAEAHYSTDVDGYSANAANGMFPEDIIGSVVKKANDGTIITISRGNGNKLLYDNELNIQINPPDERDSYSIRLLCTDVPTYNNYRWRDLDGFAKTIRQQNLYSAMPSRDITEEKLAKFIELAKQYLPEFIGDYKFV